MKKFLSLLLAAILITAFAVGCGEKKESAEKTSSQVKTEEKEQNTEENKNSENSSAQTDKNEKSRNLYANDLSKQIELGKYKGIEIDTSSDDYKKELDAVISSDVENNKFYAKKESGEVKKGDTANIDYVGKKDGVAFEGGTAQGYDLEIGSGSFIPGFEDGLIGKKIGDTVDLNLTFPEEYQSADLAGKAVVFTVTINYVTTTDPLSPAEFYKDLEFDSESKYLEDANKRATENIIVAKLEETSKIKEYPEEDKEFLYEQTKKMIESQISSYGYDFKTYLEAAGQTEEQFKADAIKNQIEPMMKTQMIFYSIMDEIDKKVTKIDINAQAEKVAKEYNVTAEQVKEVYGEYQLEYMAVNEKVIDYLYKNAIIK